MESPAQSPATFTLPEQLPVMVLSDCYLFPGCFLPLFIFEERYRLMLAHALQHNRMFCIGTREGERGETILPWTTAAVIRACVKQADGTSHVMLYGLSRVEIDEWEQERPFRIAKVRPIQVVCPDLEKVSQLREEAMSLLPEPTRECSEAMQVLRQTLSGTACADAVCDILSYHFVRHPKALKALLSESDVGKRYEILLEQLRNL